MFGSTRRAMAVALGALLGAVVLLMSACGGDGDGATKTVTVTAAAIEDAPDAGATDAQTAPAPAASAPSEAAPAQDGDTQVINGRTALIRAVGKDGVDGNITFRVAAVKREDSLPTGLGDTLRAPRGANLFVVSTIIRNDGSVKVDPFCGITGAILIDQDGRNFEQHSDTVSIKGNDICRGVQPGFRSTERLAFALPNGARPAAIALWDNSEPDDYEGMTYVRVAL